jgi:NAD dependent epimerase/dehydratase
MIYSDEKSSNLNWEDQQVVVTGAGGFIGSHLVERLVSEGAVVKAFVRYNSRGDPGHIRWLPDKIREKITLVTGDLRDHRAVHELLRGANVVFHLAALIGIPYSYVSPNDVVETNVFGTLNVLNAVRDLDVQRMIHTSTSEVYGTAQYAPIDEAHPLRGQSPYSASKIGADKLAESYYRSFGTPVATVRPFNTYGPRQSARAVIPTIIAQALTCNVIKMGSLKPRRDFTFVRDTVDGFIRVAAAPACLGEVINIGSGVDVTVGEVVQHIEQIIGRSVQVELDDSRIRPAKSEVMRLVCDNRKAAQLAGWKPRAALDQGLRETIEWIAEHIELYPMQCYAI